MSEEHKKTFAEICTAHSIDISALARSSGIPLDVIARMLAKTSVMIELAEKVLSTLSSQTGQDYSLETVVVNVHRIVPNQSTVARIMQQIPQIGQISPYDDDKQE